MTFAPLFPVYTGFSGCPVSEHSHRQVTAPQGRDEVTGEELRYRNRPLCQQQLLCASGPHTDGDTQTSGWAVGTDNTNDKDDDDGVCVCVCVCEIRHNISRDPTYIMSLLEGRWLWSQSEYKRSNWWGFQQWAP